MKHSFALLALLVFLTASAQGQIAQGPATGSIPGGVTVNTDNFANSDWPGPSPGPMPVRNKIPFAEVAPPPDVTPPTGPIGSNYISFPAETDGPPPIVVRSFNGIPQTNSIPPDPHVAVGPNHVMQVVNTSFRITDKAGNTLKTIAAAPWYAGTVQGVGPFDPKVHYDHFAQRWIMVWLDQSDSPQRSYYLMSVSDDSNPLGVWFNWAFPGNANGSTTTNTWADYQGVGFDSLAYYFTSNQFVFGSNFSDVKLRILPKAQFLQGTPGQITWTDFWDLRDLSGNRTFGTRPSVVYGNPGEYYLVGRPNFTVGTYFVIYRVTNPTGTPSIAAVHVPVTAFSSAPPASQLGGGALPLEGGGSNIRCEPVYRNNSLWIVHSVASGPGGAYSAVRYVRFNTLTNTAAEDVAVGLDDFWHFYPALDVDRDGNVAITFSRSGLTEYAGAFMSWRLNSDPPSTLRQTVTVQAGRGNYVVDFGSGRNRWGDYMGIKLDPTDQYTFWSLTEYAAAVNTWGVWVHAARLVPYSTQTVNITESSKDFGRVELGRRSDTLTVRVYNVGAPSLIVNGITRSNTAYQMLGLPTFPRSLASFDSIRFQVVFVPTAPGTQPDTIRIASNDPATPEARISITGRGVQIGTARVGVMYAASTGSPDGSLYSLNTSTGAATRLGGLGVNELGGLAMHPTTRELWGSRINGSITEFFRVSSAFGDAMFQRSAPLMNVRGFVFWTPDTVYGVNTAGVLYRWNPVTGDTATVGVSNPSLPFSGLTIHPVTRELWASVRPVVGGRDRIYRLDRRTAQATLVGSTGFNLLHPGITFDGAARLYGVTGSGSQVNNLISIRTDSAIGTLIGPTTVTALNTIFSRSDSTATAVDEPGEGELPQAFALEQNYPNPFNPETEIRFALPRESRVALSVYNVIGQEVARLVDGVRPAGTYTARWNGRAANGAPAPSGVYLYRLDAENFTAVRKMVLMK